MGLVQLTPPDEEPLTYEEAKAHLRLTDDAEKDLVTVLILAAREHAEARTRRAFVSQVWRLTLDAFPRTERGDRPIVLAKGTLQEVVSVQYRDAAGALVPLDPTAYVVDASAAPGRIHPAYGTRWPTTRCEPNAVQVEFRAGYGPATKVPASLKAAMKLHLGLLYENREAVVTGTIATELPMAYTALLRPFMLPEFG